MSNSEDAERAIIGLNGLEITGRNLVVKESKPQEERSSINTRENKPQQSRFNSTRESESEYLSVKLDSENPQEEDLPMKVKDETDFTKSVSEDGLVKISFGTR